MNGNRLDRKRGQVGGWASAFLRELLSMPRRHIVFFVITTALLILLEVELTEGWHLVHILEVVGGMLFLYLVWTAWWSRRNSG
jgi:threonine/homoserine/homoserine lactone efflux protein